MKNKIIIVIVVLICLLGVCLFLGWNRLNGMDKNNYEEGNNEVIDYSKYDYFVDISWMRETEYDTEYLYFANDGGYSYYCSCGNPVNDSDLCEGYTYDEDNKTISLKCENKTSEMVTDIKIVSYDENTLELDFNGDIRIFKRSYES